LDFANSNKFFPPLPPLQCILLLVVFPFMLCGQQLLHVMWNHSCSIF
jgi:hypothetical protein